jgi:hypothetical protein
MRLSLSLAPSIGQSRLARVIKKTSLWLTIHTILRSIIQNLKLYGSNLQRTQLKENNKTKQPPKFRVLTKPRRAMKDKLRVETRVAPKEVKELSNTISD